MSQRVLSTEEARVAITQVQGILTGGLADQIQQLENQGQILSDPGVWDGTLATQFRNEVWPSCQTSLQNTVKALQDLQSKVQRINQDIMVAGGNA